MFSHMNIQIVGSYRTLAMDVCLQVFCVYISLCQSPYVDVMSSVRGILQLTVRFIVTSNSVLE